MKIAAIKDISLVDGEGTRMVIFMTGCIHNCEGCHNPLYQKYNTGWDMTITEIVDYICELAQWLDGVTLSGGDPLFQLTELKLLVAAIKAKKELKHLNVWLYTGYLFEDVPKIVKQKVDVVIDGKYEKDKPPIDETQTLVAKWRGSANQILWRKQKDTSWTKE